MHTRARRAVWKQSLTQEAYEALAYTDWTRIRSSASSGGLRAEENAPRRIELDEDEWVGLDGILASGGSVNYLAWASAACMRWVQGVWGRVLDIVWIVHQYNGCHKGA